MAKATASSLFLLNESNTLRRATKFLIEWPPFECMVLLTIIANCVVLAIEKPLPNGDKTELTKQLVSATGETFSDYTKKFFYMLFDV